MAILNSGVGNWFISHNSSKYSESYNMLEVGTLSRIRVPEPAKVRPEVMKRLIALIDLRLEGPDVEIERKIDLIVAELYGLATSELHAVGIE
jgi:hypothetical protein